MRKETTKKRGVEICERFTKSDDRRGIHLEIFQWQGERK